MKKWIIILWMAMILFVAAPLNVDAAESNAVLAVENNQVTVSVNIPEGKTGVVTSLNMQLRVSSISGTMDAPTFTFDQSLGSEVKNAAVTLQEDGTYLVDLILSGKKDKDIFGDSESVKLGVLSVRPAAMNDKIQVEAAGEQDGDGIPVVKYMDANGITVMTAPLADAEPVQVEFASQSFSNRPVLKASVKNASKYVYLSWEKIEGADGYEIYEVKGKKAVKIKDLGGNATTYSKKYQYATTYSFKIRAYQIKKDGSRNYGSDSNVAIVTVGPDKVKGLSVCYKNSSKVTLTWKKTKGASGYVIYRSTKKNGKYVKVKDIKKGKTTSCTLKHPLGKTYYYKVKAYIRKAPQTVYGGLCAAEQGKTTAPKLKVSVSGRTAELEWKKVPRAGGYKIYRSKTKSGKYKLVKTINDGSEIRYTEMLPEDSGVWYYKVRAYEKPKKGKSVNGIYSSVIKAQAKENNP